MVRRWPGVGSVRVRGRGGAFLVEIGDGRCYIPSMANQDDQYPEQEAQQRLSGILKGAFKASPEPHKVATQSAPASKLSKVRAQHARDR